MKLTTTRTVKEARGFLYEFLNDGTVAYLEATNLVKAEIHLISKVTLLLKLAGEPFRVLI